MKTYEITNKPISETYDAIPNARKFAYEITIKPTSDFGTPIKGDTSLVIFAGKRLITKDFLV
ncbi:MAG: hypothetical protein SNJ53_09090 [Thermodesulfovibrionales bacterium]